MSLNIARVAAMAKNDYNGKFLTSMNMLHTVSSVEGREGSCITFPSVASSQFLLDAVYKAPTYPVCISNLSSLGQSLSPNFRGTFRGMVVEVDSVLDFSTQGQPKRKFKLVDPSGAWLNCCASGANAKHKMLFNGSEVVMYFGCGRGMIGSEEAAVYAFKDVVIVLVARHVSLWPLRLRIEF